MGLHGVIFVQPCSKQRFPPPAERQPRVLWTSRLSLLSICHLSRQTQHKTLMPWGSPHLRDQFSNVSFPSCFLLGDGDGLVRLAMGSFKITSTLWRSGTLLFTLWINSKPKFKYQLNLLKCCLVFSNPATKFPEFLAEWLCYLEDFFFFFFFCTCSNPAVVFVAEHSRGVPEVILPFEDFSSGWNLQHFCPLASTK